MRILPRVGFLLLLVAGLQGCATCELVEAELRVKSEQVEQLEHQVVQMQAEIQTLRQTIHLYQDEAQDKKEPSDGSAVAYTTSSISRISFGRLTGGRDANRDGFDEALLVVLACHDYDGDIFKCPGTLRLSVSEPGKGVIGEWHFTNEQLRDAWRGTLVSQGYQFQLLWQRPPESSPVRLLAEFMTLEGRRFVLEKEITLSSYPVNAVVSEKKSNSLAPRSLPSTLAESVEHLNSPESQRPAAAEPAWSTPPAEYAQFWDAKKRTSNTEAPTLEPEARAPDVEVQTLEAESPPTDAEPVQDLPPLQQLQPVTPAKPAITLSPDDARLALPMPIE